MAIKTLKEQAFTHVLYGIMRGEYPPDTLINEKQLCNKLQISKSPVRGCVFGKIVVDASIRIHCD